MILFLFTNVDKIREILHRQHKKIKDGALIPISSYFVRERLLNILADAIKTIIPATMLYQRIKKFPIVL